MVSFININIEVQCGICFEPLDISMNNPAFEPDNDKDIAEEIIDDINGKTRTVYIEAYHNGIISVEPCKNGCSRFFSFDIDQISYCSEGN